MRAGRPEGAPEREPGGERGPLLTGRALAFGQHVLRSAGRSHGCGSGVRRLGGRSGRIGLGGLAAAAPPPTRQLRGLWRERIGRMPLISGISA